MAGEPWIGRSVPRKEGRAKVTGQARYVDDLALPGMLHGVTVRSPAPRGTIRQIEYGPGMPWDEFIIVTAADIPGSNVVALIAADQPYLAAGRVNHPEEPVLLLAHADKALLEEARRQVTIHIDPLPPVFTIDESLSRREVIWGADNIFKAYTVGQGDVDGAWSRAAAIVEGEYQTGSQEQLYIEPNGMIAVASVDGVTVWGSLQCPYYVHNALAGLFGLAPERIRVVQMETGGGFGGKEEYPSIIAGHAALLAWKSGRPVKMVYDRAEDMAATTKRHPSRTRHRTAIDAEGRLLAMDIDFVIDGGAYCTLSPVVLSRGTIHAPGPYYCPNIRVRGRAVATNTPPHGAFRGFGAPQSIFAVERHMDVVAAAVGLAPDEFRRRNFIRTGQTSAVGQVMRDPVDMSALLDRALSLLGLPREAPALRGRQSRRDDPARHRLRDVHARRRVHRVGRGSSRLASWRWRAPPRAGSACSPRAPRSGRGRTRSSRRSSPTALGIAVRRRRGRAARYRDGAEQRPDRRLAHLHGRRQAGRVGRAWAEVDAVGLRPPAGGLHPGRVRAGVCGLRRRQRPADARPRSTAPREGVRLGRRAVSRRRLWLVRVGGLRRRGQRRHDDVRGRGWRTSSRCRKSGR